ncbi:flagellar basal body-associated FliL family protein [Candidatus Weimeria sp. HCP3S3_B5]|uniref:flagellar basal body-associated FliL family protein n=1 Tax=Candidatus Weimeria sp. HCP3S3_B5 TaxID=3438871 RepID=UPI003054E297|nr:flagellar basal body-associated FliL family protein [Lachnospiraceae bacterium]
MKKSLITMITLALVLVNLLLTAILAVAVLPEVKNANSLISKVAAAIDLDSASSGDGDSGTAKVALSDQESVDITGDDGITVNLKSGDDGQEHYAVVKFSLTVNKKAKSYKDNSAAFKEGSTSPAKNLVIQAVQQTLSQHTVSELRSDQQSITDECTAAVQKVLDKEYVVGVVFTSLTTQ